MRKLLNKKIFSIFTLAVLLAPSSVFASRIYIDTNHSDFFVGDTVMFGVRIDSENENINAVEGAVILDYPIESASLVDINTSGSKFSLWPNKPQPLEGNTGISFAGGSPSGLNSKDATIFNIVLKLQKEGTITLAPSDFSVYLNDGKGTKDKVDVKNLTIDILSKKSGSGSVDDLSDLTSGDKTPPESFKIHVGQEESVFDGKKFLSFNTTDTQSGIAYYEVIEAGLPPIRSNGTYILKGQGGSVKVTVIAYDSAGNARVSTYKTIPYAVYGAIVFVLLIVFFIIYKKRKKK